jgi:hypothetical protein
MTVDTAVPDPRAARRWARQCVALGVALLLIVAVVVSGSGGPAAGHALSSWGLLVLAGAAFAACLWRSRQFTGRTRWAWAVLGTGLLLWGAGQFAWLARWAAPGAAESLFPLLGGPGVIGLTVLVPAGLLLLPSASQPLANRLRSIIDGLLIAASLILVAWILVMDSRL